MHTLNGQPSWSPDGSKIALESDVSGEMQVWTIQADGTSLAMLTSEEHGARNPAWSSDGHIYYVRWDENGKSDIWRVHPDGSGAEPVIATERDELTFSVSRDGAKIIADTDIGIVIYTTTGLQERIVAASGYDLEPSWSPDRARFAFIRKGNVWRRNADRTALTRLTTGTTFFEATPGWRPDDSSIVFASNRLGGMWLWTVAPDGTNLSRVMDDTAEPPDVEDSDPAWSWDGTKIAFSRNDMQSGNIYFVNADGTGLTQVTRSVSDPMFSPAEGVYNTAQSVTISCSTPGASIHYTTDGTVPTESSATYAEPISVERDTTILALTCKADWFDGFGGAKYEFKAATPAFSPDGGTYTGAQGVTITCATPDVTIRYTTDGTEPDENSMEYTNPVLISENKTLKAKAWKTDWTASDVKTADYVIQ